MVLDGLTVLAAATVATLYKLHTSPMGGAKGFVHGTFIQGRSMGILLALLCGYAANPHPVEPLSQPLQPVTLH